MNEKKMQLLVEISFLISSLMSIQIFSLSKTNIWVRFSLGTNYHASLNFPFLGDRMRESNLIMRFVANYHFHVQILRPSNVTTCRPISVSVGVAWGIIGLILKFFIPAKSTHSFPLSNWAKCPGEAGRVLPIMAYTGRLRPKGVPFSRFRYMKGKDFTSRSI